MRNTKILAIFFLALFSCCWIAKANTPLAAEPTAQPTNLVFPMVNNYSITLSFTAPYDLPDGYLVVRSVGTAPNAGPVDGVTYSPDAVLANGNVIYAGNALSFQDNVYSNGEMIYYAIYAYNGSGININYLTLNPLSGSQQSGNYNGDFFSRGSGNWHDPSIWSAVSHTGPPSDTSPDGTGGYVFVGDGHHLFANENVEIVSKELTVGTGATLNLNGFSLSASGALWNYGSILNGGELYSWFGDFQIYSYNEMPVFTRLRIENFAYTDGTRLFTDIVLKEGVRIMDGNGRFVPNGFTVYPCIPPSVQPSEVTVTDRSGDHATVQWVQGNGDRSLVVARHSSIPQRAPKPGVAYMANTAFGFGSQPGTGNFVVYSGSGSSVTITGLGVSQEYFFDVYTFNQSGNCYNVTTLPKVEVISPVDGKTMTNIDLQVRGRLIVGYYGSTTTLQYSIDVCPSDDFASGVVNRTGYGPNHYFTGLQYNTQYFTRVKTNASPKYSKITTFTTAPAHHFTYMVSPSNLAVIQSLNPTITSSPVSGAATYTIELNTAADFTGVSRVQSGARSQRFNGLLPGIPYYVRIKTNLDDVWGVTRSFSINPPAPLTLSGTPSSMSRTSVSQEVRTADEVVVVQVSPNPFRERFTVYVNTREQQPVEVSVLDVVGRETTKMKGFTNTAIEINEPGTRASGVYLVRLRTSQFSKVVRVVRE